MNGRPAPRLPATLHVDLAVGQSLAAGDVLITLVHKAGRRARLIVQAPASVRITHPRAQECASLQEGATSHGQHAL